MAAFRILGRWVTMGAVAALSAGCSTWPGPGGHTGDLPSQGPIIPDTTLRLTPSVSIALEKLVFWGAYAGAAYLILDPLAPNWDIEQAAFPDSHFHLSLRMKRVYSGGAGEARAVFHQRARELMRQGGYDDYRILDYAESLESSVLGSQRTARGVIRLVRN